MVDHSMSVCPQFANLSNMQEGDLAIIDNDTLVIRYVSVLVVVASFSYRAGHCYGYAENCKGTILSKGVEITITV